ncbi:glycosyltransferase family 92 protein [Rhodoplanes serenus]|uniref:glycosyltransferase family 92 protein n=1 Tax=Rhodoplanes serenus TaxID=200615 RepID=UPI000DADC156|nr:glycosyltransferase family 92 protein [Rhodoplanes serenus]RAI34185.1 hypothetical protein CH340_09850 [Rhodoplanes serenus]
MANLKSLLRSPWVLHARARDRRLAAVPHVPLAICAIFKDEAPYLGDWVAFHHAAGVGRFYLYDNGSADAPDRVLRPHVDSGLVRLIDWPHPPPPQLPAYRHCIRTFADEARWIAFIDIDEFLFSPQGVDLPQALRPYEDLPGVIVASPFFGSSGHAERPAAAVPEAYTRRAPLTRISAKTIANPRHVRAIRNVHTFKYWQGDAFGTDRRPLAGPDRVPPLDVLRLNHYWSRSLAELHAKVARGDASTRSPRNLDWHLSFEAGLNAEEDLSGRDAWRRLLGAVPEVGSGRAASR